MMALFNIAQGLVSTIMNAAGFGSAQQTVLPQEIIDAVESCGFFESMSYVTNADAGCGLIRYGSALVPFINRFPRDTKLYELMTTKPGEGVFGGEKEVM